MGYHVFNPYFFYIFNWDHLNKEFNMTFLNYCLKTIAELEAENARLKAQLTNLVKSN